MFTRKHLVSVALASALLFTATPSGNYSVANAASVTEGTVTSNALTVRSGASANHKAIDWLRKGEKVTILKDHGTYSYVQYGAKKGYVHDSYLKMTTKASTSNYTSGTVTAYSLTVRSGPSANNSILDYLKKGTTVTVLKDHGSFVYVQYGNKKGYVHQAYLKLTKSVPPSQTTVEMIVKTDSHLRLNVRKGPSTSHAIIGKLKDGLVVKQVKTSGSWSYIEYGNTKGYVHSDFLKKSSTKPPTTVKPPTTSPTKPTVGTTHTVRSGDTLWGISKKYNTTVFSIKQLNGLKNNTIHIGQQLKLNGKPVPVSQSTVLKGIEIVIDPGHGGQFAGARSYLVEEDVNLQISLKVRSELEKLGAKVIMTRTSDVACAGPTATYTADLLCRSNVAKKNNSNMFVSIHANAATFVAKGTEVFWYNSARGDQKLSTLLVSSISKETGLNNRGSKFGNFSVLRNSASNVPSALVETGFVTNKSDSEIIGSASGQDKIAKAIAKSISTYYGK